MAVVPRPRQAIENDLRGIPAMRAASSGDPVIDLERQDIIDARENRLLDELWAGMTPHQQALTDMRPVRATP